MPEILNQENLNFAKQLLEESGPSAMYDYLSSKGYNYATLANGVARGDSLGGAAALSFMKETAENTDHKISESQINNIRGAMAKSYLDALSYQANSSGGFVLREMNHTEAWAFHKEVFRKFGLSEDCWTLNTPLMLMDERDRETYWQDILSRAGDTAGEAVISARTANFMSYVYIFGDPSQIIASRSWFSRMIEGGSSEIYDALKASIGGPSDWLDAFLPATQPTTSVSPTATPDFSLADLLNYDYQVRDNYRRGQIGQGLYNDFNKWSSDTLRNNFNNFLNPQAPSGSAGFNFGLDTSGLHYNPIGAFYDSRSLATDSENSIADQTYVLFDQNQKGVSAEQLSALDSNGDGQLSGTELNSLSAWADLNENGQVDTDEIKSLAQRGITGIRAADFVFFTQGNSRLAGAVFCRSRSACC